MKAVRKNKAVFVLANGEQTELSMTDLIDGFELGLRSIDNAAICRFLLPLYRL